MIFIMKKKNPIKIIPSSKNALKHRQQQENLLLLHEALVENLCQPPVISILQQTPWQRLRPFGKAICA